jgi:hypothetical protein
MAFTLGLLLMGAALEAREIPEAVRAYDQATQAKDIEASWLCLPLIW